MIAAVSASVAPAVTNTSVVGSKSTQ